MVLKKLILSLGVTGLALGGLIAGHVLYLYTHREFGPQDFQQLLVLSLTPAIYPEEEAQKQAAEILHQKFTYLGYGGQMTAYESEDHQYVIKFFNPRAIIRKSWFRQFSKWRRVNSLRWIKNTYFRQEERLLRNFHRYAMAFQDLKEESGLIYVHLDPSTSLSQKLHLVDKEGAEHEMELDKCPFVLQKKVELTMHHLGRLLKEGAHEQAKESVEQIYQLFLSRAQKGYTDRLQTLHKNYGFFKGRAIQLDVGRIEKVENLDLLPEMERIVSNITPSLKRTFPQLAPILQECLKSSSEK
ncbi:MAG: hypothetical protein JSS10_00710 [Verrucomicrobia bacterium]|nr:hypothetical protein [Verrucomicrobiota bacterium]